MSCTRLGASVAMPGRAHLLRVVVRHVKIRTRGRRLDDAVLGQVVPNRLPDVIGPDGVVRQQVAGNAALWLELERLERLQVEGLRVVRVYCPSSQPFVSGSATAALED